MSAKTWEICSEKNIFTVIDEFQNLVKGKYDFNIAQNKRHVKKIIEESTSNFYGSTASTKLASQLHNPATLDMQEYESKKRELNIQKFAHDTGMVSRRRRSLSEHDGDWDYDRRWDIKQFQVARRQPTQVRIVNIAFSFSIACGVAPSTIDEFGRTIWAIVQSLEEMGYNCNVDAWVPLDTVARGGSGKFTSSKAFKYNIKNSQSYVERSILARVLSSPFYRQALFTNWILDADRDAATASEGLGYVRTIDIAAQYEDPSKVIALQLNDPVSTTSETVSQVLEQFRL